MEGKYRGQPARAHLWVDAMRVAAAIIPVCGFEAWIKFNRFFRASSTFAKANLFINLMHKIAA
jgi:hypothetical protein